MTPVYRVTVYAPRSVDPAEATALTPVAGASHSDPFVVTSVQGIAGSKPYLDLPTGRGGTIDALNAKTTVGSLTIKIMDARVTPGGGNAARWVTVFLGDGSGGNNLLGRKVLVEQSTDGGTTWEPYFTGRIASPALSGKLWMQLSLRDIADDLALDIVVGAPHAAVASYAALAQIAPLGLLQPQRSAPTSTSSGTGYAGLPLTTALRGLTTTPTGGTAFGINLDTTNGDQTRTLVTQALIAAANRVLSIGSNSDVLGAPRPKAMVALAGSGDYKEYDLNTVGFQTDAKGANLTGSDNVEKFGTSIPRILVSKTNKPGAADPPAAGTAVDYYIIDPAAQPSDRTPLLIDDVNPVTYLADLCAGRFGRLDSSGAVIRSVPFNANGIDGSKVLPWRNWVTKASKLNTELEAVCAAYRWTYYVDASGTVTLVDLRRSATTSSVAELTDDDLDSPSASLGWQQDRESAVTSLLGTYYLEQQISPGQLPTPGKTVTDLSALPDIPTVRVTQLGSDSVLTAEIGVRSADMKPSTLKVDAPGMRYVVDTNYRSIETWPPLSGKSRLEAIRSALLSISDEVAGPFGLGPAYVDLVCRRASSNARAITPGKYATLSLTALPDPATNLRGGTRLGFCVSRTDDGPRIKLRMLDAGADSVALPPTLGVPTLAGGIITLPVTLNAASEPVRVAYASTDLTVAVRPADSDPLWTSGPMVTASGNAQISNIAAGRRVWFRARSLPGAGTGFKLPSSWTYPATASIDLAVITPPSGVAVSGATLDAQLATWTNGDPTLAIEMFLAAGVLLLARDGTKIATLPAGAIRHLLPVLTNGSTYTLGIRHVDSSGGASNLATLTFTVAAASSTLDAPTNPNGFSGSQDPRYGFPQQDGVYGLAVAATAFPGYTEFAEELETAPNSGIYGSPVTIAKIPNVQGDWTIYENVAPNDGLRRVVSARHVRDGASASAYTVGVVVIPWTAQPLGLYAQTVGANAITRVSETESSDEKERIFTLTVGALVDTVHAHFRTVPIDATGDVYDFSGNEDVATDPELEILDRSRDFPTGTATFSLPHPPRDFKIAGRFVPFTAAPHLKDGESRVFTIVAAPPAINVRLTPSRVGATGALSLVIAFGPSDGPGSLQVYAAANGVETTLVDTTVAAPVSLSPTDFAALGNLPLPEGKDSLSLRAVFTDVSGQPWPFGPALLNRDPLPNGTPHINNYRSTPSLVAPFDPDTDQMRYTSHLGKVRTITAAQLLASGSPFTHTVGLDAFDDASVEDALGVDETRSGAKLEYQGGSTWVTMWAGDLHGTPKNPPTARVDTIPNTDASVESVQITPDTQVDESLLVFYRQGVLDTTPQYQLCASATVRTPRAVVAGTTVGAADFFARVDGTGSPATILNDIALGRDQIVKHGTMIEGADSGMQSGWIPVTLSLLGKPWLASTHAAYDPATRTLSAKIIGGARTASVQVLLANNAAFASPITLTGNVADGATITLSSVLSAAQLGKTWYIQATPYSAVAEGGLPGDVMTDSVFVPALTGDPVFTVSESGGNITLTTAIDDPASIINTAWTNGIITTGLSYKIQKLGVGTVEAQSSHTLVGTLHTWTKVIALDELHPISIAQTLHFVDGSAEDIWSSAADSNKVSDVVNATVANSNLTAAVTVDWDTDTLVGSNCARYSLDGGTTWTSTVTVSSALLSQFNVTRIATKQTVLLQAKNALDGNWGNQSTVEVDAYVSEGPTLNVKMVLTSTTATITWSGTGIITVAIDSGSAVTPLASPISVTLDSNSHTYNFFAVLALQTVSSPITIPALASSGGGTSSLSGIFSALVNTIASFGNPGTVHFGWTPSGFGAGVNVEVWVRDVGKFGDSKYHQDGTTTVASGSYTYTAGESLSSSISPFVTIGFSLRAVSGTAYGTVSAPVETNYGSP